MKTRLSIRLMILSVVGALSLGGTMTVYAQAGGEMGEAVAITAEVVGIDKADRTILLLGPDDNVVAVEVGEEARNFDQIKVGDEVKIEYYEAVALYLGKPGEQAEATADLATARSAKGEKPAGVVVETVDMSATVQDIDKTKRTVTLKGPQGHLITTKVDKSVQAFDSLKVGDTVHARYTEALAISVATP